MFNCTHDISPDNQYTCDQQKLWGKCQESWMNGWCCMSCNDTDSCGCNINSNIGINSTYTNVINNTEYIPLPTKLNDCDNDIKRTDDIYGCKQQSLWGKCGELWMTGYCCHSCGNISCSECSNNTIDDIIQIIQQESTCDNDVPPDTIYTCRQQAAFGKCGASWMDGHCCQSCPESCQDMGCTGEGYQESLCKTDIFFADEGAIGCKTARLYGKCTADWMVNNCCISCPNACGCGDIPFPVQYTIDVISFSISIIVCIAVLLALIFGVLPKKRAIKKHIKNKIKIFGYVYYR